MARTALVKATKITMKLPKTAKIPKVSGMSAPSAKAPSFGKSGLSGYLKASKIL